MSDTTSATQPVLRSGMFAAGPLRFHRLGYGAMQLTGPGVWGPPKDREGALAVLRRAVELGVDLVDTADSYGPEVSEDLIRQALHPYPEGLVIATKAGLTRAGPGDWRPVGRPEYLRQQCEMSLRNLGVERVDLYQLHRIDPKVALEDQLGELTRLQSEGKVRHIGLSEVSVAEIEQAARLAPIATVQNRYNVADRASEDVLEHCEATSRGFIPWFPLATGELARPGSRLSELARAKGSTPAQLALAWLLHRSPVMLPIPGTSKVAHLEDNMAAALVELSAGEVGSL